MKLTSINIERFRSIENANNISLKDYTVLIGKNNEGKSNIVSAISLAFRYYESLTRFGTERVFTRRARSGYEFEVDYPVKLQTKSAEYIEKHPTKIELTFTFSQNEIDEFWRETKLTYNSDICIQLSFDKNDNLTLKVKKEKAMKNNL